MFATVIAAAGTWTDLDFSTGALQLVQTFAQYIGVPIALIFALWGLFRGIVNHRGGGPQWGKVVVSLLAMAFLMNLSYINDVGHVSVDVMNKVSGYVQGFKA